MHAAIHAMRQKGATCLRKSAAGLPVSDLHLLNLLHELLLLCIWQAFKPFKRVVHCDLGRGCMFRARI